MASPISLKNYISRRFSAMAVLPVITIAGLTWGVMMPAIKTRTNIQQQGLARSVADRLSARLAGGERQLAALAAYLNSRAFTTDAALTDLLDAQCGNGEFFEALFIIDNTTFSVQAAGLARARRQQRSDFIRLDFSGHRFIHPPKNAQPALWSKIFLSRVNSRPVVSLTLPLTKGFIIGELTLDKLAGFINLQPQASKLLTLIIDEHGTIIADSQKRYWGHIFPDGVVSGPESTDKALTNSRTFDLNGQKMLGAMAKFEKTGWNILAAQPVQHVYQPLWKILSLIGMGLAATLILALPTAWFLAGKFTRIFTSYTERAASLARGNYDIHWPEYKTKESLLLGQSLRDMARKIEQREKELKAGEQRTRDLLVNVPGVIYQYTVDPSDSESGTFTSPAIERSIEIFELDFEQKNFVDLFGACIPENDRARFRLSFKKAIKSHSPWHYEGRFIKPSGKEIWFEGRSHPRQTDGLISHYGVFTDITRRKELEASLRLTQFCFDKAPIGIWRIGKSGNVLDVNEHGCESLGYSRKELCRMSVFDFAPAFTMRDWENAKDHWNRADHSPVEALHQRRSGEVFPIQIIQKNMTFENREYSMAFVRDITEQKKVEQILQKNETDLRQLRNYLVNIIDSMPSIIVAVDSEGRITLWNHLAEKETGLNVETALSQPLEKLFPRLARETNRIETAIR
ncbi:MAG: PAS domain S-box protein, partial [Desulfobacterales bacterium]|nr:PAS domain S-box protein [Desulfobacterales bacterium]